MFTVVLIRATLKVHLPNNWVLSICRGVLYVYMGVRRDLQDLGF